MKFMAPLIAVARRCLFPAIFPMVVILLVGGVCSPVFAGENTLQNGRMVFKRDPNNVNAGFLHDGDKCAVDHGDEQSGGGPALVIAPDSYSYSVTGNGCGQSVYGVIDVDGVGGVSGYLYLENGKQTFFYGDWIGKGVAEGFDSNGNLYTVIVDE